MNYLESQKNVVMVTKVIDFSPDSLQMNCPKYLHIRGFKSWPSQTVVGVICTLKLIREVKDVYSKPGDVNRSSAEMRMSPRELPVDVLNSCLKTTHVGSI